jgi:hypothetical protein
VTTNPTMTAAPAMARSLPEILAAARMVNCGHCGQAPGQPCAHSPAGSDGFHVARLARAFRRGLVSGPELITVLQILVGFTWSTVVYQEQPDDSPPMTKPARAAALSAGE